MSDCCQHIGTRGQCAQTRVDGSDFCIRHSNEEDRLRSYRLADPDLRARFDHHAGSESLQTVKSEVILLRILIEERLGFARNEAEKISAFQTVQTALSNLSKMVETLSKLERQTNVVLGKDALNMLSESIVDILVSELANVEGSEGIIDRVAGRIGAAIAESHNKE